MDIILKRNKLDIKKIIIGFLLILVTVFGFELFENRNVIFLSSNQKGIIELTPSSQKYGEIENGEYISSDEKCEVVWDINSYVNKFEFDYEYGGLLDSNIVVGYFNSFGNVEEKSYGDLNSVFLNKNIVNIRESVKYIKVIINNPDKQNLKIVSGKVINKFEFNTTRMFITFSIMTSILALYLFRKSIFHKLEIAFVFLSLFMGISLLLSIPSIKVGWDEESHFMRAYKLAIFSETESFPDEIYGFFNTDTLYNWPLAQPGSKDESKLINDKLDDLYMNGQKNNDLKGWTSGITTPGYVFEAMGIKLAKLLGLPFTGIIFLGRFFSLLSYIILIYFSIKFIPIGKEILFFISLMPTTLFISVTFNYDVVVFGFITLGISLILREMLSKNKKVSLKTMIIVIPILAFGCLPKAVYAPLVLLPLAIPKNKYKNVKECYAIRALYILLFALLMSTFVLPTLLGQANNDIRGGAVDSIAQLKNILAHPISYTKVLIKNIWGTFESYTFGEAQYRLLAHLKTAGFQILIPLLAVIVIISNASMIDNNKYMNFNIKNRVWCICLIALSVALIWTSLYMAYTVPGVESINGVQGRYYKPILPLFYLFLSPGFLKLNIDRYKYRGLLIVLCFFILLSTNIDVFSTYSL